MLPMQQDTLQGFEGFVEEPVMDPALEYDVAKITQLHSAAKQRSHNWHEQITRWRRWYNFDHYNAQAKANETLYPDPTPTNVVDVAVGIFMGGDLEWRAHSFAPSPEEEKDSSQIEKFLAGALQLACEREGYNIPYEIFLHAARDGAYVLRTVWDPVMSEMYQSSTQLPNPDGRTPQEAVNIVRLFEELPARIEVVDPLEISLLDGGPRRWRAVFQEVEMSIYDAEETYDFSHDGYGSSPLTAKMEQKGKLIDAWILHSPGVIINAVLFDGKFIPGWEPEVMEGYSDLPFDIGFYKPVSRSDSKDWGHGAIRPLESSVSLLEKSVNRRARQIDTFTGLPMVIKALPGRDIQIDPGFVHSVNISPDEDIAFPLWPGNPPDVRDHITYLRSRVQQAGFSDVMFGGAEAISGFALSQMADQNRIRLLQPVKHLEQFFTTWAKKLIKLTSAFAGNSMVRVYGQTRGKDFAAQVFGRELGQYNVRCKLNPEYPNEKVRKHAMATQVKGTLSDYTIMQNYLDIEQPDDERERRLIEQAQNHPMMQLYGVLGYLQEQAENGDGAAEMALQVMMQQGIPGLPGAQGPKPDQGAGLAGPGGEPPPQAMGEEPPGQSEEDQMAQRVGAAPNMIGMAQ